MAKPKVKPMSDALANIESASASIGTKYVRGIDTGKTWKDHAGNEASEALYNARMQEVLASKSRQRGVSAVSEEDWRVPAKTIGGQSIGQKFRLSKDKWAKKTQPYLDVIANTEIADKTTDFNANIDGRLKPIVAALKAKKKELKG